MVDDISGNNQQKVLFVIRILLISIVTIQFQQLACVTSTSTISSTMGCRTKTAFLLGPVRSNERTSEEDWRHNLRYKNHYSYIDKLSCKHIQVKYTGDSPIILSAQAIDNNEIDKTIIRSTPSNGSNTTSTTDNGTNTTTTDQNSTITTTTTTSSSALSEVEKLRQQAKKLREEVVDMRLTIQDDAETKEKQRIAKIDLWLNHLLINQTIGGIEQLNTVPQVVDILIKDRYSPEQVYQIFERLCTITSIRGRDSIASNQLLQLLIESVGKMDEIERVDNSNKRWSQVVERTLHKRLFAMEWGINLEKLHGEND